MHLELTVTRPAKAFIVRAGERIDDRVQRHGRAEGTASTAGPRPNLRLIAAVSVSIIVLRATDGRA